MHPANQITLWQRARNEENDQEPLFRMPNIFLESFNRRNTVHFF